MQRARPTREEKEFRQADIDVFVKRYGLEGFADVLDWLLTTIRGMIIMGEIPETKEGIMKAMALIVSEHPEVDQYLRKFSMAVALDTVNEIKQAERPN